MSRRHRPAPKSPPEPPLPSPRDLCAERLHARRIEIWGTPGFTRSEKALEEAAIQLLVEADEELDAEVESAGYEMRERDERE